MRKPIFRINKYNIKKNQDKMSKVRFENTVHQVLESGWSIGDYLVNILMSLKTQNGLDESERLSCEYKLHVFEFDGSMI